MKMYLSSYKFGDEPQKLADLFGENKKIAVIFNALDFSSDLERRNAGLRQEVESLTNLGLEPKELDLRNFFGKKEKLLKVVSEFGGVWVRGGNTFVLRSAFKESGFDEIVLGLKSDKSFVYAGYSAGVCVLCPSLRGVDLVDEPNLFPDGYPKETVWEGLGILDFMFVPHFESDHPESDATNYEVEFYKNNKIPYKTFRDGEVVIRE